MTMLDRMRRHKNWLKWSLALVCLAFVVFYIPDFLRGGADASPGDVIARVEGREITAGEFSRTYQAQLQAYRGAYGGNVSEQLLKQLGIEQQILQQMVDERASLAEAERLGIRVGDAEVRERIFAIPAFQENGRFIGEDRYRQFLRMQRPPVTPAEFEERLRQSLVIDKLRAALTDWIGVPASDVEQEYKRRNEKIKLELIAFLADKFRDQVTASDAELESYFNAHKEQYRVGEKRKIRYLLVDVDALRAKVTVAPRDVERYYNDNIEQYSTPEQVRAAHILLKTEGKDEAAVRAKAEALLKQAREGADFSELATQNSDDEGSAAQGGDLDYFGRGRMVPEFEEAAFSLPPGSVGDLVKTQYGFHIIKVIDKKAASTRSLEEVRQQIADQVARDRAQAQAGEIAQGLEAQIRKPADLDKVARSRGLTVNETGFFTREEPITGLGPSPEATSRAFEMKEGEVSGAARVSRGLAIFAVSGTRPPAIPALAEVRDRVREDVIKQKAREVSVQRARAVASTLKSAADFGKAAKAAALDVKTTELIPRDSPIPDLGVSPEVDRVAFALPVGAVSDPITTEHGTAIVKVVERKDATPAEIAAQGDQMRQELLNERRTRFFSAYMVKAKRRMRIEVNRDTLQRVVG